MTVKCAWAAWDENHGARGGAAGDQTGGEVHTGPWWYFGQNCVIRPKNDDIADKIARVMEKAADNENIGYDQSNRLSFYEALKAAKWDPAKITKKVETDCSAMTAAAINAAGVKISPNAWTGNLWDCVKPSGKFERLTGTEYTQTDVNLKRGDIVLNEAEHVIVALENGANMRESGFSTHNMVTPSTIVKGTPFVISGKVKSHCTLKYVTVGVINKDTKKWEKRAYKKTKCGGTVFDISTVDPSIHFAELGVGNYLYRVVARDTRGTVKRLINKQFSVVLKAPKKSLKAIAREIYRGECSDKRWTTWGDGTTRKERLKAAGYTTKEIREIQELVNAMF